VVPAGRGGGVVKKASTIGRIAVAAILVCLAASGASAQLEELASSTPQERASIQTAFMKRKLALTPEQLPKIEALNLEYAQKMQPVITGSEGPLMKMRAAKGIEGEKDAALQNVLTPDQNQKWLAAKDELRQEMRAAIAKKAGGTP
jgi:hypothetical protein